MDLPEEATRPIAECKTVLQVAVDAGHFSIQVRTAGEVVVIKGKIGITAGEMVITADEMVMTTGDMVITEGKIGITAGEMVMSTGGLMITANEMVITWGEMVRMAGETVITSGEMMITSGEMVITSGEMVILIDGPQVPSNGGVGSVQSKAPTGGLREVDRRHEVSLQVQSRSWPDQTRKDAKQMTFPTRYDWLQTALATTIHIHIGEVW